MYYIETLLIKTDCGGEKNFSGGEKMKKQTIGKNEFSPPHKNIKKK